MDRLNELFAYIICLLIYLNMPVILYLHICFCALLFIYLFISLIACLLHVC